MFRRLSAWLNNNVSLLRAPSVRRPRGYNHLRLLPFEVCIAGLCIISGIIGLLNFGPQTDALTLLLPALFVSLFNVGWIVSGLLVVVGLSLGRGNIEGSGLVLLLTGVFVRGLALIFLVGVGLSTTLLLGLYTLIVWACYQRLSQLVKRQVIVRLEPPKSGGGS